MKCHDQPSVAVIMVNYNGGDDTRECLLSLRKVDYPAMKIILVDNASTDGSFAGLLEEFPEVVCIRSEKNLGFTGGNNLGLARAYELRPRYVFLLNNDTTVSSNTLTELSGFMESHPEVGLAGPLTCYYSAPEIVAFGGGRLNRNTGIVTFVNKGVRRRELNEPVIYCNFIEGAGLFVRTDLIQSLGGFNDLYFLTSEESELCVQIADLGYRLAVINSCCIWHKVSQSMGAESELANYFIFRNKLWFIRRNARNFRVVDLYQIVRYSCICLVSFALRKRNVKAAKGIVTGIIDFFRGMRGPGRYKAMLNA